MRIAAASLQTPVILCACFLALPLGVNSEDWAQRLKSSSNGVQLASDAQSAGEEGALLRALAEAQDASVLDANFPFIRDCLPGGNHAASLSADEQALAIELAGNAPSFRREVFFRLLRLRDLTPDKSLKERVTTTLKAVPADQRPEGIAFDEDAAPSIDPVKLARGKEVYMRPAICFTCHQPNGKGIPGAFPPLADSEWMDGDSERLIKIVLKGMMGPLEVNGQPYNSVMAPLETLLTDDEIADVLTYVKSEWGDGKEITTDQVSEVREAVKSQTTMWSPEELLKQHPLKKK